MADDIKPIPQDEKPDTQSGEEKFLTQLSSEFESFKALVQDHLDKQIEQNKFKDETINRLQKTVSEYEKGLVSKIKEPLIWSLVFFKDSFEKFREKFDESSTAYPDAPDPVTESFEKFREKFDESSTVIVLEIEMLNEELEEILSSHGLEKIVSDSDFYDREKQIVRKKEITENQEEDRRVVKILKNGYHLDGKLFRKEEIVIKVLEQASQPNE